MARSIDPALAARNERLVADARENPFKSDLVLGEEHGLKAQRVRQILTEANLINANNRRKPLKNCELKSRSNLHTLIGQLIQEKFNTLLEVRPTPGTAVVTGEQHMRDCAMALKFTVQTLRRVMWGTENITVSDIQRIAEWMGKTPSQMFLECEQRASLYSAKKSVTTGSSAVSTV